MSQKPALRFDHREIAVVFSLFVFVSLLMFTVGILVGKGLATAKYEALLSKQPVGTAMPIHHETAPGAPEHAPDEHADPHHGTPSAAHSEHSEDKHAAAGEHHDEKPAAEMSPKVATVSVPPDVKKEEELELIPLGPQKTDWNGTSLKNQPHNEETKKLMENPKIAALTEKPDRKTAAVETPSPKGSNAREQWSYAKGDYTVQVGSYPNEKDAEERVKALKSMGYAHAYFSAKDLGDSSGTWYRVWLGYFPNYETAKKSGDRLQARGEVKNFIVRKNEKDSENGKN